MTHYDFTDETSTMLSGSVVHRIILIQDHPTYGKKGTVGGFIEKRENLIDDAWVSDSAVVYNGAVVSGEAWIHDDAEIYNNSKISGSAEVFESAQVFDTAEVYGKARIHGSALISHRAKIYGEADVYGEAKVYGEAHIFGDTKVYDNVEVYGKAKISGVFRLSGNMKVYRGTYHEDLGVDVRAGLIATDSLMENMCLSFNEYLKRDR